MDTNAGITTSALRRLEQIRIKNKENPNWMNQDLYRLLYKEDIYISAYENIKSNKGGFTPGTTIETFDDFSLKNIQSIIELMRENKFEFRPARRIYIPKPGTSQLRPLGIPNATDKLVQEIIRLILETIYEPSFSENSHGFRPQKSCHTALKQVETQFNGVKWLIEGDIEGAYDNVDHKILLKLLKQRINDERFIILIKKALKAGYLEYQKKSMTSFIGTPQGSIISPILFNIYLNPLDKFLEQLQESYKSKYGDRKRKTTTEYNKNATRIAEGKRFLSEEPHTMYYREELVTELRRIKKKRVKLRAYQDETIPLSIYYVRYADDWIVGVNGPRHHVENIKAEIAQFIKTELNLDLSPNKTKIIDIKKDIGMFLGYEIRVASSIKTKRVRNAKGVYFLKRTIANFIKLNAPIQRILSQLCLKGFCDSKGNALSKRAWTTMEDHVIVKQYNWIMNGLFHYYSGANNQRKLIRIQYILQHSCACTLAHRHKSTIAKIYGKHGRSMEVNYTVETKNGPKSIKTSLTLRQFNNAQIKWFHSNHFYDPFKAYVYPSTKLKLSHFCWTC